MQHNGPAVVDDMNVFVQVTHQYSIMLVQRLCVRCNSAVTDWKKNSTCDGRNMHLCPVSSSCCSTGRIAIMNAVSQ